MILNSRTPFFLTLACAAMIGGNAWGFIPGLTNMVKEVLEGRNSRPSYIQIRHRVRQGDQFNEVDEQIFQEKGRTQFAWKARGQSYSGTRTRDGYSFDSDKRMASKSAVFLRYFLSTSSEELLSTLVNEGFVRQTQTQAYKTGFLMEGDPSTWNLKENFLIQPDIFMVRLPVDTAIVVVGTGGEDARMVFFDDNLRGIRRFEWRDGGKIHAWNFAHFAEFKNLGRHPKLMNFEVNGQVQVESSLVSILAPDARKQPKPMRSNASIGGDDEQLIDVLLSYR